MKKRLGIIAACFLITACALGLAACGGDVTVYTVTFIADGVTVGTETYTVEDKTITEPEVPAKVGYIGEWESYSLTIGDVTVNAAYTPIEYIVTFIADGVTVGTETYTVEDKTVIEPEVPAKAGYIGEWESYSLTIGDVTVNAVYTPIEYTVTFIADGVTVGTETYTVEDKTITEPEVPAKAGYIGEWESYSLSEGDITVNAVYTAMSPEEAIIGTFYQYVGGKHNKENYFIFGEKGVLTAYTGNETVSGSYTIDENSNITFTLKVDGQTFTGDGTLNYGVIVLNLDGQFEILCQEGASLFEDANGAKFGIYNEVAILCEYNGQKTSYVVPNSIIIESVEYDVVNVANYAFKGCNNLTDVTIGANVTSIGNYVFQDCNGLTSVTIGESVTNIGWTLYEGHSLTIYAEVTEKPIGWHDQWISYDCPVVWDCKNNDVATDGVIYYVDGNKIRYAIKDGEASVARQAISIAEAILSSEIEYNGRSYNVTSIGTQAFIFCDNLNKIIIPNGITSIDEAAFRNCSNLKDITISDSVESIGSGAFYECTALTDITIPNSVTSIGPMAFAWCSSLTNIAIPESVTNLDNDAFEGCDGLSYISVAVKNPSYSSKDGILYDKAKTEIIHVPMRISGAVAIPNGVVSIPAYAFEGCSGLTSITIPDGVDFIGRGAFSECRLEQVNFMHYTGWEYGSLAIASETFKDPRLAATYLCEHNNETWFNDGTYQVTFVADGVTVEIIDYVLGEENVTEPAIPAKAGYRGTWEKYALGGYVTVNAVYTPIEYTATFVADGITVGTVTYTVEDKEITEPPVPEKPDYIGTWEDYELKTEDITINAVYTPAVYTVTFVADGKEVATASYTVENTTVTEPAVPERENPGYAGKWENYTLTSGNITVNAVYSPIEYIVTFVAGDEVAKRVTYTVENRTITEPEVPAKTGYTGVWESYTLTFGNLTVRALYTTRDATHGLVYKLSDDESCYWITGYTGEEFDVIMPSLYLNVPVAGIAENAFSNNSTLVRIYFPIDNSSFKTIGIKAFYNCSSLEIVEMSTSLVTIGESAFEECCDITRIAIPDSVTSIGNRAFFRCIGLTDLKTGNSVTSIGDSAFSACSGLTRIAIPDSVTNIGRSAFSGCSGLTSLTIGNGVTSIGDRAFNGCNGLTSVTIGSGLTSVDNLRLSEQTELANITVSKENNNFLSQNGVLYDKSTMTFICVPPKLEGEIIIPDGVQTIVNSAFENRSGLTGITIPDSVTAIGSKAFLGCSGLTSITIPDGVTSIGSSAFNGCNKAYIKNEDGYYLGNDNNPYLVLIGINDRYVTSFNIRNETKVIYDSAFSECSGLTSITIPNSVTSIGYSAFSNCSGLTSITIPSSVTSIGKYAFERCSGLTSITIPDSVMSIGSGAFSNCSGLTSITIPFVGATKDGTEDTNFSYIFINYGYSHVPASLKTVVITGGNSIDSSAFWGCSGLTSITIPDSVTSIGAGAFWGCSGLTSITIPDSVTSIGSHAFSNCSGLTSITIPEGVTSIGSHAFSNCSGLTSITIPFVGATKDGTANTSFAYIFGSYSSDVPASLKTVVITGGSSIGEYAFSGCSGLTSITIPNSVTSIGSLAFSGCSGLTSITIPNSVTSIGSNAFYGCSGLASITIGNSVTSIGSYAFYNCSGLTSITIPDSVTSIGSGAFGECSGLTSITIPFVGVTKDGTESTRFYYMFGDYGSSSIPASLKTVVITGGSSIGDRAFYGCSGLTSITIPNSVKSIGSYAFEGCSGLTSITIPEGVTSIGSYAFSGCSGLTSITIPFVGATKDGTENTSFAYIFGSYSSDVPASLKTVVITGGSSIDFSAFRECSALTSITIPNSVKTIGSGAFWECSALTSITIPNSVKTIGSGAFWGCSGLTSITIPDSVTSIGEYAFYNCSRLTSITIPDSVTSIGDSAFSECSGLTSITYTGTIDQWRAISKGNNWNDYSGNYTITCNDGKLDKSGNIISE